VAKHPGFERNLGAKPLELISTKSADLHRRPTKKSLPGGLDANLFPAILAVHPDTPASNHALASGAVRGGQLVSETIGIR
jgi:hypothetical protein